MNKKSKILLLAVVASSMISLDSKAQTAPAKQDATAILAGASWLLGEWSNETARGSITETWVKKTGLEFAGKSYVIRGRDTVSSESILLKQEGDDIFYIPTVKGQNNELPVKFKLVSSSANELVFENPAHDFPQKIRYTLEAKDSLVAEISGLVNGQRARKFPMKRVN